MPAIDASMAGGRSGSTSSYHSRTRSGVGPPSAATACANAATSNSAGPTDAKGQSNITNRSPRRRTLSERVSKWSNANGGATRCSAASPRRNRGSASAIHLSAAARRRPARVAVRASSPLLERLDQNLANSVWVLRGIPEGGLVPIVAPWNAAYERAARWVRESPRRHRRRPNVLEEEDMPAIALE